MTCHAEKMLTFEISNPHLFQKFQNAHLFQNLFQIHIYFKNFKMHAFLVSQTPKPLPRHQAAPAYSFPKGKVSTQQKRQTKKAKKATKTNKERLNHVRKGAGLAQNRSTTPSTHTAPTTS